MIEINLIPDVKRELLKAQSIRAKVIFISLVSGIASIAVVASLSMYVFTVQTLRNTQIDKEIEIANTELTNYEDLSRIVTIQNQLTKISSLNSNKKIDSRIFNVIKAINPIEPNDIQIGSLVIDAGSSTIAMDCKAFNGYAALELFQKTIKAAKFKYTDSNDEQQEVALASSVSTTNSNYTQDSSGSMALQFSIIIAYAPELFSPASINGLVSIPAIGNATDSYLGVPRSILVDSNIDIEKAD